MPEKPEISSKCNLRDPGCGRLWRGLVVSAVVRKGKSHHLPGCKSDTLSFIV